MKKVTEAEVYKLLVRIGVSAGYTGCLLYTSDAADD